VPTTSVRLSPSYYRLCDYVVETTAAGIRITIFGPAGAAKLLHPTCEPPFPRRSPDAVSAPMSTSTTKELSQRPPKRTPPPPVTTRVIQGMSVTGPTRLPRMPMTVPTPVLGTSTNIDLDEATRDDPRRRDRRPGLRPDAAGHFCPTDNRSGCRRVIIHGVGKPFHSHGPRVLVRQRADPPTCPLHAVRTATNKPASSPLMAAPSRG
jgi:hypothetical protein